MRLRIPPFILAALLIAQVSAAQGTHKLYATMFSDPDGRVYFCNLDGTGLGWFGLPIRTKAIALDWSVSPHKLYIGLLPASGAGKIIRCNTDGTNVQDVVTTASSVSDIELDLTDRKVYWTQNTWDDDRVALAPVRPVRRKITYSRKARATTKDILDLSAGLAKTMKEVAGGVMATSNLALVESERHFSSTEGANIAEEVFHVGGWLFCSAADVSGGVRSAQSAFRPA